MTDGCVLKSSTGCDFGTFVVYFVLASLLYTIIFTFTPSIIGCVRDCISSLKTKDVQQNDDDVKEEILAVESTPTDENVVVPIPLPISAYVTMIFLFFQLASLLHVKQHKKVDPEEEESQISKIALKPLFDFFNFQFSINQELCPTTDLTLPIKEFINIALKMCSILNLFVFFIVWKGVQCVKFFLAPSFHQSETESESNEPGEITTNG